MTLVFVYTQSRTGHNNLLILWCVVVRDKIVIAANNWKKISYNPLSHTHHTLLSLRWWSYWITAKVVPYTLCN